MSLTESKSAFRGALEDILPDPEPDPQEPRDRRRRGGRRLPGVDPPGHNGNGSGHDTSRAAEDGTRVQVAERISHAVPLTMEDGTETELDHGHVVIAAITSCTNTSNPSVMIAAGLLARTPSSAA